MLMKWANFEQVGNPPSDRHLDLLYKCKAVEFRARFCCQYIVTEQRSPIRKQYELSYSVDQYFAEP
jgi:hypothetical protein